MSNKKLVVRALKPLTSRKVRVAFATVLSAYAAEYGLDVSEEIVLTILGVGASLILGIAHEDAGRLGIGVSKHDPGTRRVDQCCPPRDVPPNRA